MFKYRKIFSDILKFDLIPIIFSQRIFLCVFQKDWLHQRHPNKQMETILLFIVGETKEVNEVLVVLGLWMCCKKVVSLQHSGLIWMEQMLVTALKSAAFGDLRQQHCIYHLACIRCPKTVFHHSMPLPAAATSGFPNGKMKEQIELFCIQGGVWLHREPSQPDCSSCDSPAGGGQQPGSGHPLQRAGQHGPGAAVGRSGSAGTAS